MQNRFRKLSSEYFLDNVVMHGKLKLFTHEMHETQKIRSNSHLHELVKSKNRV